MQRALAFDQSPPLSVAFRFFLNVPIFLLLAALFLVWTAVSGSPFARWTPRILAAAHFLTLGVLASAMLGAMMQILPVATNIRVLCVRITSPFVHVCLSLGTLFLAAAFLNGKPLFHVFAVVLLAAAFLWFSVATTAGLLRDGKNRSAGSGEILVAVRLALLALVITVVLGVFMAGLRGGLWGAPGGVNGTWLHRLPDLHVLWGLAGWVGLLIIGISYQVIPIFQATEIYPRSMTNVLAPLVFLLLVILTLAHAWRVEGNGTVALHVLPGAGLVLAYLTYGGVTTWLLKTRKRPSPEPTTWFWHTAMAAMIVGALVGGAFIGLPHAEPGTPTRDMTQMLFGTLLIVGIAVSAVNGMLYKIVPFLLWHNAQRRAPVALPFMPKVKQFIPERDAMRQFVAHLCAVVLLAAACVAPILLLPGAIALAASAAMLAWNIARAMQLYTRTCHRITEAMAARADQSV